MQNPVGTIEHKEWKGIILILLANQAHNKVQIHKAHIFLAVAYHYIYKYCSGNC